VFELYGFMLALHHDARLLRDSRAAERARVSFVRAVQSYGTPAGVALMAAPSMLVA